MHRYGPDYLYSKLYHSDIFYNAVMQVNTIKTLYNCILIHSLYLKNEYNMMYTYKYTYYSFVRSKLSIYSCIVELVRKVRLSIK